MSRNLLIGIFISAVFGYLFAVNVIFLVSYLTLQNFLNIIIFFSVTGLVILSFNILYGIMGYKTNLYKLAFVMFSGVFIMILM
ncbi:hypothetical protein SAMN05192557_1982 [Aliicoccus persicus]|uniref:Uncharacterized protein n=1 Tax=Aliicoccus persicus TaxID=930138 RepID=A0A662Z7T6_9STAP|nr:hypothetical protein SAMN05192557_1982 [Aliicoccus persicus]